MTPFFGSDYGEPLEGLYSPLQREFMEKKQALILEQLGDLVSKGLLVIQEVQPVLVKDDSSNKITLQGAIRLTLRDKEYIEKLEKENKALKAKFEQLRDWIKVDLQGDTSADSDDHSTKR